MLSSGTWLVGLKEGDDGGEPRLEYRNRMIEALPFPTVIDDTCNASSRPLSRSNPYSSTKRACDRAEGRVARSRRQMFPRCGQWGAALKSRTLWAHRLLFLRFGSHSAGGRIFF